MLGENLPYQLNSAYLNGKLTCLQMETAICDKDNIGFSQKMTEWEEIFLQHLFGLFGLILSNYSLLSLQGGWMGGKVCSRIKVMDLMQAAVWKVSSVKGKLVRIWLTELDFVCTNCGGKTTCKVLHLPLTIVGDKVTVGDKVRKYSIFSSFHMSPAQLPWMGNGATKQISQVLAAHLFWIGDFLYIHILS